MAQDGPIQTCGIDGHKKIAASLPASRRMDSFVWCKHL
jgi:hypothetical protein